MGLTLKNALQLMGDLDFPQAVEEIKQAAKWLREEGAPKVGLLCALSSKPNFYVSVYCQVYMLLVSMYCQMYMLLVFVVKS